jgi:hypothetical protein
MAQDKNFTLKITLAEANALKHAAELRLAELQNTPIKEMVDKDKEEIGHLEKMLRIDF